MNLIKDKIFLGVVTFLLFISLSITLLQIDTHLILLYLLLLNGTIITGFFAFGWVAGGMLWLMASILSLYRYAGTGSSLPYICIAIFSMTYFIAYRYFRSLAMFQTEFLLKKQRIDEDINLNIKNNNEIQVIIKILNTIFS